MNCKTFIYLLPCVLLVSSCTQTRQGDQTVPGFEELDTDANGYISKVEASTNQGIAAHFKQIDSNTDGKITISEFASYMGKGRMTPPEEMETPEPGAAPY